MKSERFGTLKGLTVGINVYSSVDEAEKAAGRVGAVLDEANASLAYRGPLSEAREILCDLLEEEFKMERQMEDTGKKDAQGNAIMAYTESEGKFAARVAAAKGLTDLTSLQAKFDAACAKANDGKGLEVDIKKPERKPAGPRKLPNLYREKAAKILANKNTKKFLAAYQKLVGRAATFVPTGDAAKDTEALGWLCREYAQAYSAQGFEGIA